ncbi:MAG: acetyl-CoA hydrolase/transferase C-terminal domain-containing protein [Myxococcota bacterium]|nr:acetyl-CoA hydrolase/transferase C-terminal domain-containing protein [Myxococcota bacterium]
MTELRPWQQRYRSKLLGADKALSGLPDGAFLYLGGNAATPRHLAGALARIAGPDHRFCLGHVLLLGQDPVVTRGHPHVRHLAWFVGPADRAQVNAGEADYVPCNLSEVPRLVRELPRLDAALLMVSPPDRNGQMSLGTEVMASLAAAERAQRVIVQVNRRMPRVLGNTFLHVDDVDAIVEFEEPLPELRPRVPTQVEQRIAENILPLIEQGATLQLGIGGIPDAVIGLLCDRQGMELGVHSEMISDGVMNAVEAGVVTCRFKTRHRRKVVTTFILGSRELYDWVDDNPLIEAHPCDHTNDLLVASQNDKLVAINSAISVDLSGQVNSDSIGQRVYSGVGGQVDFMRAASRSKGGVPILAIPSTAQRGASSRIVDTLAQGAGVVTPRADLHWVVTEYGAVNLYGASLRERRRKLSAIAHPDFRAELGAV